MASPQQGQVVGAPVQGNAGPITQQQLDALPHRIGAGEIDIIIMKILTIIP
jgi:hypothetical protein